MQLPPTMAISLTKRSNMHKDTMAMLRVLQDNKLLGSISTTHILLTCPNGAKPLPGDPASSKLATVQDTKTLFGAQCPTKSAPSTVAPLQRTPSATTFHSTNFGTAEQSLAAEDTSAFSILNSKEEKEKKKI